MKTGYLALVLHAHLPFVKHPESTDYLEERWLFEAITETYLPLLHVYETLMEENIDFRITMSMTPTLISMLQDPLLQERYEKHLVSLLELAHKERERVQEQPEFQPAVNMYIERFSRNMELWQQYGGNLLKGFRKIQDAGKLELITSAATHAFLPLVMRKEAVRAQIATGVELHTQVFGKAPKGIWLPECGYFPGIEEILRECQLQYFFVDTHGVLDANPQPLFGVYSPIVTARGVAAFARDPESSKQVWSSQEGYPGDPDYREYYRDIGFDLDLDTIRPYIHKDGIRIHTGMKYYRITGQGVDKQTYQPQWASEKAAIHAGNFMFNRQRQVEYLQSQMGRSPIVVAPYDAELFGHWWFEGPQWIDYLFRKIYCDQSTIACITPSEYLNLYSDYQECQMSMSSWGRHGYADVWLQGNNDWVYPALHEMEAVMIELTERFPHAKGVQRRVLNQAARELMLAQSSDWAFIMDSQTFVDYAVKRTKWHVNRFHTLVEMLETNQIQEDWLTEIEIHDSVFPDVDYRVYHPEYRFGCVLPEQNLANMVAPVRSRQKPSVVMLSWEFPPMIVGGLSRHVYDLSIALVKHGWDVHVITGDVDGCPAYERVAGVHVHRAYVQRPAGESFHSWVFQLNLAMIDCVRGLLQTGLAFELIHAHDWLVCLAAKQLKQELQIPLLCTIHATEWGRNHGIHSDLQHRIHNTEWQLTYESERVIVCSESMLEEVCAIFWLDRNKVDVIPNGVDFSQIQIPAGMLASKRPFADESQKIIFFVGRLVREKGVHLLIEAAPSIIRAVPEAKIVIAGRGPMLAELEARAIELGISESLLFTGFIEDSTRNQLLQVASVCVFPSLYEPFGIVALEAMAAGTPVVVSDTGGLKDIVTHGVDGATFYTGHVQSLSDQIVSILRDEEYGRTLAKHAKEKIYQTYQWDAIAEKTIRAYQAIRSEHELFTGMRQVSSTTISQTDY
ncbi:DUF1957 domain-containing protein [Fodinisporobacter ferrooxydans]|uniref:DUF1957 domain-containing protein n=1 Tax=Fodinisporobacter ferrooxydans TaxID=2901836 RepID=A0ABY4CJM1_9BACL|nr:DUF1957 domain-containing protein [Alicyclobacillaceae bacterium MYW30-H2]